MNRGTNGGRFVVQIDENSKSDLKEMMNTLNKTASGFKLTADWSNQSKKLKEKFSQLTQEDLVCEAGKESEMLARVATRLNKNQDEVIALIQKV